VFWELSNLSKTGPSAAAEAAREALQQVKVAYTTTELKILDSKGIDITKQHLSTTKPMEAPACDDSDMDESDDPQKGLFGVTRSATELSLGGRPEITTGPKYNGPRGAILLTEDRMTRIRAAGKNLAALAPTVLKKYLENGVGRMRSLSRGSQGKPSGSKASSPTTETAPMLSVGGSHEDSMETGQ
jgi:hypothetical protein